MTQTKSTHEAAPRAVMIAVQPPSQSDAETQASLLELAHQPQGLGAKPYQASLRRRSDSLGALVLRARKLGELRTTLEGAKEDEETEGPMSLVFDGELTLGQQRNLAREFDVNVLSR